MYGQYGTQEDDQPRSHRRLSWAEKERRKAQRHAATLRRHAEQESRIDDHEARFEMHFDGHGAHARVHHECDDCPDDDLVEDEVLDPLDRIAAGLLDSTNPEAEAPEDDLEEYCLGSEDYIFHPDD